MDHLVIAVIGAGGKTTTMRTLARQHRDRRVLFTTTTHIFPLEPPECRCLLTDPTPERLLSELEQPGVVCAGHLVEKGKLASLPQPLLERAMDTAELTLCEADGANRLPLKLHRAGEPVVPSRTDRCVIVAGLSALGVPVQRAVHRWQLDPDWAVHPERPVDEGVFVRCILDAVRTAGLPLSAYRVLLNQTDTLQDPDTAERIMAQLCPSGLRCRAASLAHDSDFLSGWVMGD